MPPTYDQLETSEHSGEPIELYKFANARNTWRYTSSTEITSYLDETYNLEAIVRRNVRQSTNLDKADLLVTIPRTSSLVKDYLRRMPATPYWLTLFRLHASETGDVKQLWQGRIMTIKLQPTGELAEVKLESIITAQNRLGLQPEFQALCNHHLYDGIGCPVLASNHARAASVTAIGTGLNRDQITVSGLEIFPDEHFEAGFVEISDGDQRDVVKWNQATGVLTLDRAFSALDLQADDPVTVYDGCKHRWIEDCVGKFGTETNNGEAHGGFPTPAERSPFKAGVQ